MTPVILLHGALGAASSLAPLKNVLEADLPVLTLDFSGHGNAGWPEASGFSIETFESDVLRFMDQEGIAAAHLFGYSMGGFVGLRLAARWPERILSVTTLATKMDWTPAICEKEASMLQADVLEVKVPKFVAALEATHPANGWRRVVEHTRELLYGMSRYRFTDAELAAIAQPVRLLVGDRDKMVTIEETLSAYRALSNASFGVLPGTPHPLEAADIPLLAEFIRAQLPG